MTRDINKQPKDNYFSATELHCHCAGCSAARAAGEDACFNADQVQPFFHMHLNRVREDWYGKAMPVSSGFRCLAHPLEAKKVRAAQREGREFIPGDHPNGVGVDIRIAGADALELLEALAAYNKAHTDAGLPRPFTAIALNQRGPWDSRFIHIGANPAAAGRPRPHTWSY